MNVCFTERPPPYIDDYIFIDRMSPTNIDNVLRVLEDLWLLPKNGEGVTIRQHDVKRPSRMKTENRFKNHGFTRVLQAIYPMLSINARRTRQAHRPVLYLFALRRGARCPIVMSIVNKLLTGVHALLHLSKLALPFLFSRNAASLKLLVTSGDDFIRTVDSLFSDRAFVQIVIIIMITMIQYIIFFRQ